MMRFNSFSRFAGQTLGAKLAIPLFLTFFSGNLLAATAESQADVSWMSAFSDADFLAGLQRAGSNPSSPEQSVNPTLYPSDLSPQILTFDAPSGDAMAQVNATGSLFTLQSNANDGRAAADALLAGLFTLDGSGTLDIQVPYDIRALVTVNGGTARTEVVIEVQFLDSGFGTVEDSFFSDTALAESLVLGVEQQQTGILQISESYDAAVAYASLNLFVTSDAFSPTPTAVPLPAGILMFAPALIPFFRLRR